MAGEKHQGSTSKLNAPVVVTWKQIAAVVSTVVGCLTILGFVLHTVARPLVRADIADIASKAAAAAVEAHESKALSRAHAGALSQAEVTLLVAREIGSLRGEIASLSTQVSDLRREIKNDNR